MSTATTGAQSFATLRRQANWEFLPATHLNPWVRGYLDYRTINGFPCLERCEGARIRAGDQLHGSDFSVPARPSLHNAT